jgi:hypothetical protein
LVAITTGIVAGLIAEYFAIEAYVAWYMEYHNVAVRGELGEDLGFGIVGFAISAITFLTVFFTFAIVVWRKMRRVSSKKQSHA